MEKIKLGIKYCNLYFNKFLLKLGSDYGKIRISDVSNNLYKLDINTKNDFLLQKAKYDLLLRNVDVDKIKSKYEKIFIYNILNIPNDLITLDILYKCKFNCDEWLKLFKKTEVKENIFSKIENKESKYYNNYVGCGSLNYNSFNNDEEINISEEKKIELRTRLIELSKLLDKYKELKLIENKIIKLFNK